MEAYNRGSHTVWDCKYHVVWVTKYRHPVLGGDVGQRCRELLRETASALEIMIHARAVNRDNVHMLLSIQIGFVYSRPVGSRANVSSEKTRRCAMRNRKRRPRGRLLRSCCSFRRDGRALFRGAARGGRLAPLLGLRLLLRLEVFAALLVDDLHR
jgi:REP element-mobilizing transposase RayT